MSFNRLKITNQKFIMKFFVYYTNSAKYATEQRHLADPCEDYNWCNYLGHGRPPYVYTTIKVQFSIRSYSDTVPHR